jgi:cytochrome c551/c552
MKEQEKAIKIKPACEYPSQWDDLIGPGEKVIATIYTFTEGAKDNLSPGITQGKDGIYDIVVHAKEINNEVVRNALNDLARITGRKHIFMGSEDESD